MMAAVCCQEELWQSAGDHNFIREMPAGLDSAPVVSTRYMGRVVGERDASFNFKRPDDLEAAGLNRVLW